MLLVVGHHAVDVERIDGSVPRRRGHFLVQIVVGKELARALRERLQVAQGAEVARLAVHDELRQAAHVAGHHGHLAGHRFQGRQPERFRPARHEEDIRDRENLLDRVLLAEKAHIVVHAKLAGLALRGHAVRPIAYQQQLYVGGAVLQPVEHLDHLLGVFDRAEVGDVHNHLLAVRAQRLLEVLLVLPHEAVRVDEVRNHLNVLRDVEVVVRFLAQVAGDGRHAVRLVDGPRHDGRKGGILADKRDIGAVKRGDDGQVEVLRVQNLAGHHGARRVRKRVVHVQEVEPHVLGDVHHLARQGKRVRRIVEEGIALDVDLVEEDVAGHVGEPKREIRRDEVDLVAAFGEALAEFRSYHPAAAVGGITGDADFHERTTGNVITEGGRKIQPK